MKKSKDFVVYFFAALIKHKIRMKYEKCIVSISYFVVFRKKHSQNTREMRNTKVYNCPIRTVYTYRKSQDCQTDNLHHQPDYLI